MPFTCSICEEESTRICVRCTKDTCANHLCEKCGCCSDCCECEIPLETGHDHTVAAMYPMRSKADPEPEPEPPHPPPDPDPFPPEDEPEPGAEGL